MEMTLTGKMNAMLTPLIGAEATGATGRKNRSADRH
jgi:hypothetical protein